jgi:hypothetical protein
LRSTWSCVIPLAVALLKQPCVLAQNPVYDSSTKQQKAEISILAISSSVHSGGSGNQEIYLADVLLKGNAHQMAKLVDAYPPTGFPIRRSVLVNRHLLRMTLVRNPDCDSTGGSFFLAPGGANIFEASTRSALNGQAAERIPCGVPDLLYRLDC